MLGKAAKSLIAFVFVPSIALALIVSAIFSAAYASEDQTNEVSIQNSATFAASTWTKVGDCEWIIEGTTLRIRPSNGTSGTLANLDFVTDAYREERLDRIEINTGKVYLPVNSTGFFSGFNIASADLSALDSSQVTNMAYLFGYCTNLESLDLSSFNTSKVTDMSMMFMGCRSLKSLNLNSFNTKLVTDMSDMFRVCYGLEDFHLPSTFSTSKVKDMSRMFHYASVPAEVSTFDTSNVTDMRNMFEESKVNQLDLSKWDTSNVTTMSGMFLNCQGLEKLNVSNLYTKNVTSMSSMFSGCSSLKELDLSNFNTSYVEYMDGMFDGCKSLHTLTLSNKFVTDAVGTGEYGGSFYCMFSGCSSLTSLDLSTFNGSVTDMAGMFSGCSSLKKLDLSSLDTSNIYGKTWEDENGYSGSVSEMFKGCTSLVELDLSSFETDFIEDYSSMFEDCSALTKVKFNWNTDNADSMQSMFEGCRSLKTLDLISFGTKWWTNTSKMFANCSSLSTIYVNESFSLRSDADTTDMFSGCNNLVGQNGTRYLASIRNGSYARIDNPLKPGYFTGKSYVGKTSLFNARIAGLAPKTYTGKAIVQNVTANIDGTTLRQNIDYSVSFSNNVNAGTATVLIVGKGSYYGSAKSTFSISKASQKMTVKSKTKKVKASTLKKKASKVSKLLTVKNSKGSVTYKNVSKKKAAKKFKINAKNGTITIPKKTPKGTYALSIKVTAKGNANYAGATKTATVKIKVK